MPGHRPRPRLAHLLAAALVAAILSPALAGAASLPGATPGPHQISKDGVHFIAQYERPPTMKPYGDPVHCTVGFGHKLSDYGCSDPRAARQVAPFLHGFTMAKALALFGVDLGEKVRCVNASVTAPLTQGQFDALVSFAYNAGCPTLAKMAPLLNRGDFEAAAKRMGLYTKGDIWVGKKGHRRKVKGTMQGLVDRRRLENQKVVGHLLSGKKMPKSKSKAPIPHVPPVKDVHGVVLPKKTSTPPSTPPADDSPSSDSPSTDDAAASVDCPRGAAAQSSPVPAGCYQFSVAVTQSLLRSDPTDHYGFGRGVGEVTISSLSQTVDCSHPGGPCSYVADLPIGSTVTLTQTALSESGGPSDPVDSEFDRWGGACSGSGSCSFTLNANHMAVTASFVPALVTLNVDQTGATAEEVIVNPQRGSKPAGPLYCGNLGSWDQPLPCSVQTRVDGGVELGAAAGPGDAFLDFTGDPCAMIPPNHCSIFMDADHSVTVEFGESATG